MVFIFGVYVFVSFSLLVMSYQIRQIGIEIFYIRSVLRSSNKSLKQAMRCKPIFQHQVLVFQIEWVSMIQFVSYHARVTIFYDIQDIFMQNR